MIMGRLTRDPEVRYTPNSIAVCDISLAVNRYRGGGQDGGQPQEEVSYIDVTLWRKQAELAGQYLGKGRAVFIEGYLSMDTWEDKNTGQKRSKLKVVADNMQFIGGQGPQGGGQGQPQQGGGNNYQSAPPAENSNRGGNQQAPQQSAPSFEPEDEDDIPF